MDETQHSAQVAHDSQGERPLTVELSLAPGLARARAHFLPLSACRLLVYG